MKYTKLITSIILAGAFVFTPALKAADKKAKKKPEAGQKGAKRENPLAKLDLSADQKKQMQALQKETGAARKEAGKDKDKQKEIQKNYQAKLKEILTEEQQAKMKELQGAARKGGKKKKKDSN